MDTATASVDAIDDDLVGNIARAALFAALMGALAYVSFPYPFSPVPVTLQVLGMFLAGMFLGPVWGGLAMVLYVLAGAMGAPVFALGQGGLGVLFSERIGYLVGFPIGAAIVGLGVHGGLTVTDLKRRGTVRLVAAMTAAVVVLYVLGVTGLMVILALDPWEAIVMGAIAFLPAEVAKMAAAVGIVRSDRLAAV